LVYLRERKREKNAKETKEESPSRARFASVTRNEREALEFQAIGGGENACFPWKWQL